MVTRIQSLLLFADTWRLVSKQKQGELLASFMLNVGHSLQGGNMGDPICIRQWLTDLCTLSKIEAVFSPNDV